MNRIIYSAVIFSLAIIAGGAAARADAPDPDSLTVAVKGPGQVIIDGVSCRQSCTVAPADGSTVTLRALPDPQAELVRWTGPCAGHQDECIVATSGEIKYVTTHFRYINDKNPVLKKAKKLLTTSLSVRVGCGGSGPCSLQLSGYLRKTAGRPKADIKPIYLDLGNKEQRVIELLSGPDNRPVRNGIKNRAQAGQRSQLFIRLTDLQTNRSSAMAINEKPSCCWDKPNKPNKGNK